VKAYVMQVLVIDHDEIGPGQAARELEAGRFGNDCIAPQVLGSPEVHDIGEWTDAHPLNQAGTDGAAWLRRDTSEGYTITVTIEPDGAWHVWTVTRGERVERGSEPTLERAQRRAEWAVLDVAMGRPSVLR
jgi:hypothetical protein